MSDRDERDDDKLANIPPLGKSVEEVEQGEQNRVNPPAPYDDGFAPDTGARSTEPRGTRSTQGVASTFTGTGSPILGLNPSTGADLEGDPRGDVNEKRTNDDPTDNSQV